MKKRQIIEGLLVTMLLLLFLPEEAYAKETPSYATVHDPSIVYCEEDESYYIFGSHQAVGKSTDLINWNNVSGFLYGDEAEETLAESLEWAGYKDGSTNAGDGLALWAPCVIYNPYYENEDGTEGSYMIYYPASSNYKRGCIGFAVSQNIASDYVYKDTIMYSGFTKNGGPDEIECYETVDTSWEKTNLGALLNEGQLPFNANWYTADGGYNIGEYPQAIDPTVFFDEDDNLWLLYGSHGGGIWLLPLNRSTGEPVFLTEDQVAEANDKGIKADCYFGYQLTSEGEGAFLLYDEKSGFYYLSVTYGQITDGYNMRLFRSEQVNGTYEDAAGNEAVYKEVRNQDSLGVKLMGNYELPSTEGYCHGGHNSMISVKGELFNIYHQRFSDNDSYSNRIHQMFRTRKGWLTMAVYQYAGDSLPEEGYKKEEVAGSYQFINHGTATSSSMLTVYEITLKEDETVSGDLDGTWTMENGTCYMTLNINGVAYDGVFFRQQDESEKEHQVMTFTAVGENNETVWGSMLEEQGGQEITAADAQTPLYAYPFTVTDGYLTMNEGMLIGAGVLAGNAEVTEDDSMGLCLATADKESCLRISSDSLQQAAEGESITFWAKADNEGSFFTYLSDNISMVLNEKGEMSVELDGKNYTVACENEDGQKFREWTYVGINLSRDGMELYVNGKKDSTMKADFSELFDGKEKKEQGITFGGGSVFLDNIEIYGVALSEEEYQKKYSKDGTWTTDWHIDFGPVGSPRWDVFTMMYNTTLYSKSDVAQGYGFTEEIDGYETSAGGNKIRDFVYKAGGGQYTFKMDLPNGTYSVFVYSGNKEAENTLHFYFQENEAQTYTQVTPEGVASDNYDGENTYQVYVTEEMLSITFWGDESLGTDAVTGALNSLEIVKISDEYQVNEERNGAAGETAEETAEGETGEGAQTADGEGKEKPAGGVVSTILLAAGGILCVVAVVEVIRKRKKTK